MNKVLGYLAHFCFIIGVAGVALTIAYSAFSVNTTFGWFVLSVESIIAGCVLGVIAD